MSAAKSLRHRIEKQRRDGEIKPRIKCEQKTDGGGDGKRNDKPGAIHADRSNKSMHQGPPSGRLFMARRKLYAASLRQAGAAPGEQPIDETPGNAGGSKHLALTRQIRLADITGEIETET